MRSSRGASPAWEDARALAAAVAAPGAAEAAWRELMAAMAFDEIDEPTQRLMPVIYGNLRDLRGLPDQERMRGAFKHCWSRSAELMRGVRPVLAALAGSGIECRVIGAAAVQAASSGAGARAMWALDVLVATADRPAAVEVVAAAGLRAVGPAVCERHSRARPDAPLTFRDGMLQVDVHTAGGRPVREAMLGAPGTTLSVAQTDLLVPPAELLLLDAASRGRDAGRTDRAQAIADAALLAPRSDPGRLVAAARRTATIGALQWVDSELRRAGGRPLGVDLPREVRLGARASDVLRSGERLVAPVTGLPGRIRSRQRGSAALAAVRDDFPGARRSYEAWLWLGQAAATERLAVRAHGGFLAPPSGAWVPGSSVRPFAGDSAPGLVASPVAELTLDWRFRVALAGPQATLRVVIDGRVLDRQDTFLFRNGEPVGRIAAGDPATRTWDFHDVGAAQEFSLRPAWPVCEDCYESLRGVRVTIGA